MVIDQIIDVAFLVAIAVLYLVAICRLIGWAWAAWCDRPAPLHHIGGSGGL